VKCYFLGSSSSIDVALAKQRNCCSVHSSTAQSGNKQQTMTCHQEKPNAIGATTVETVYALHMYFNTVVHVICLGGVYSQQSMR